MIHTLIRGGLFCHIKRCIFKNTRSGCNFLILLTCYVFSNHLHRLMKNCIISAVGANSLHRSWTCKCRNNTDLHLIIYDNSYDSFKNDTPYISKGTGQKFKLVYKYLGHNKYLFEKYDYFFIPDDDVFIDDFNIDKLFIYMRKYNLEIAQPALTTMHYAFPITVRQPENEIRYTNFVEIMQPCFSRTALEKCLFTFNINESGWGMDFHWSSLVNYDQKRVAIIDDIMSVHTRPSRITPTQLEKNSNEYSAYMKRFGITKSFVEYQKIKKQLAFRGELL